MSASPVIFHDRAKLHDRFESEANWPVADRILLAIDTIPDIAADTGLPVACRYGARIRIRIARAYQQASISDDQNAALHKALDDRLRQAAR